jgi:hypothetical protein
MKNTKRTLLLSIAALSFATLSLEAYEESAEEKTIYAQELKAANIRVPAKTVKKHQKQKYAGWYMRTKVYATGTDGKEYSHTTAGVFGKLKQSRWKKDQHDVPAFGAVAFQIVFPHLNWGDDSGDYYSNYYKYKKRRKGKRAVWTFQIKNQNTVDLSNASIRIELEGAQNVDYVKSNDGKISYVETDMSEEKKNDLTLVDVDNHKTYSVDELEYANLSMDGKHARTFRWVRGNVKKRDFKPLPVLK